MFSFANNLCYDPVTAAAACAESGVPLGDWYDVANSYVCHLTTRPGRAVLLLPYSSIQSLRLEQQADLQIGNTPDQNLTVRNLIITDISAVTPGVGYDAPTLYVVEAHDRRWYARRAPTVRRGYNIRSPQGTNVFLPESLKRDGSFWQWSEIVTDIWRLVFPFDPCPVLPFTPDTANPGAIPANFCLYDWPAAQALDHVLARLACAVKYNPLTDKLSIVRLGQSPQNATPTSPDADRLLATYRGELQHDAWPVTSNTMLFPAKVRVEFLALPVRSDGTSNCYSVDVPLPVKPAQANLCTWVTLWDDEPASINGNGSIDNLDILQKRAAERAADWYRKRQYSDRPASHVYIGILDLTLALGATYGRLSWEDRAGLLTSIAADPTPTLEDWRRSCACCPCVADATTTTSTTTTTTAAPQVCCGSCRWTWDNTAKVWTQTTNTCGNCNTTTTTTTTGGPTTTSTTTTTTSTTTTTPDPCAPKCTTTTSTTTSTTTTAGPTCNCQPPTFCGDNNDCSGACTETVTYCGYGDLAGAAAPVCTTTTTTSTTTTSHATTTTSTTTTTAPPGCVAGCVWRCYPGIGWFQVSDGCLISCACAYPTGNCANNCIEVLTPCHVTTTLPPPLIPCTGGCEWLWVPDTNTWVHTSGVCNTGNVCPFNCFCERPSAPGSDCAVVMTPCNCHTTTTTAGPGTTTPAPTTTPPPTTTTNGPGQCNGNCRWRWKVAQSAWVFCSRNCPSCGCLRPFVPGTNDCEIAITNCVATTTPPPTTTTVTTTTSTTCNPAVDCGGGCAFRCDGGVWTLFQACVTGGGGPACACSLCSDWGQPCSTPGAYEYGTCSCGPTCTTTTTAAPTTTTAAPDCGTCTYGCVGGSWALSSNNCTGGCNCQPPGGGNITLCADGSSASTNCA